MSKEYKVEMQLQDIEKTEQLLSILPPFCRDFYTGRNTRLEAKSQYNYACKMKKFLEYLHENNSYFGAKEIKDITLNDLSMLSSRDMEEYTYHLKRNGMQGSSIKNNMACLSAYFSYFFKHGALSKNPILEIDQAKVKEKNIVYLGDTDRDKFMDALMTGEGLTKKQLDAWKKNNLRDLCMLIIMLDTGIRVSELIGLDVDDVFMNDFSLTIQRKGDKEDEVYFSDTTADILTEYLSCRDFYQPVDNERALFLVGIGKYKGTRISVRTVENITKKYAAACGVKNFRKISPHKLRATFAMGMLKATGNISIVAEQMGHKSIKTTTIYARSTTEDKKLNRNQLF